MESFAEYRKLIIEERLVIESFLDEMANWSPGDTGLPFVVWMGEVGGQHGPRLKVCNVPGKMRANDCFVVSVSKDPQILTPKSCKVKQAHRDDLTDWVVLNYDVLMELWRAYESGDGSMVAIQTKLRKI